MERRLVHVGHAGLRHTLSSLTIVETAIALKSLFSALIVWIYLINTLVRQVASASLVLECSINVSAAVFVENSNNQVSNEIEEHEHTSTS